MSDLAGRFREDGFLVIEGALAPEVLEPVRAAAHRIVEEFDLERHRTVFRTDDADLGRDESFFASATGVHCFLEAEALSPSGELLAPRHEAINKLGHAMHDRVPEFRDFCRTRFFGWLLRQVGMERPELCQTMYVFKPPRIGGAVRWHQDASYLITTPAKVVGLWVALDDAHRGNGCLWMQPGGHRSVLREIYEVDWSKRAGELRPLDDTPWPSFEDAVPLEVPAGSVVLFHDHMPHCSSRNDSPASRHALTLHASEASSVWAAENWLQRGELAPFRL
jgi:phytanoyl-CoA hydroxylase